MADDLTAAQKKRALEYLALIRRGIENAARDSADFATRKDRLFSALTKYPVITQNDALLVRNFALRYLADKSSPNLKSVHTFHEEPGLICYYIAKQHALYTRLLRGMQNFQKIGNSMPASPQDLKITAKYIKLSNQSIEYINALVSIIETQLKALTRITPENSLEIINELLSLYHQEYLIYDELSEFANNFLKLGMPAATSVTFSAWCLFLVVVSIIHKIEAGTNPTIGNGNIILFGIQALAVTEVLTFIYLRREQIRRTIEYLAITL